MPQHPNVIIGAGPAGLTAAYELAKLGEKSILLEADTLVGGISRTVNYKGYRFDIGGHRFFSKVPYVNELWQEVLRKDFLLRPRLSRIHYRDHFFDYPLKPMDAFSGLGPLEVSRICLSYARAKISPYGDDDNFELWVANRFGYRLYNIFFKTYTEKVWGMPCKEIAADWAAQRIKNLSLKTALYNAFLDKKDRNGKLVTSLIEQFHYPRLGPGMMWERFEALLAEKDSPTLRGERVTGIRHHNGILKSVSTRNAAGELSHFGGNHFISSMPLRELIFALDPPPPERILQAAKNLRYRDYLTVVLMVKREKVFPDNWIYIHTPEVKLGRIQNYKNWSHEMVPDPSRTSLGLEYFLWEDDEQWRWSDEKLIELGIRECAQIGIIEPGEVEDSTVVRMPKAYPVYDQSYHDSLAILREYLQSFSNLQTIGRNGMHRYNNQDHSMLTGVYAARNIMGAKYDLWKVNTEQQYHEEADDSKSNGDRLTPTRAKSGGKVSQKLVNNECDDADVEEAIEDAFAVVDEVAMGVSVGLVMGVTVFAATIILLLKDDGVVGQNLSLLAYYFLGYDVSWGGAFLGFIEAGIGGFTIGSIFAKLRNWGMDLYAYFVKSQVEADENKDLLEKV